MKHETKTVRKLLSVLLALAMVIGLLPGISVTASAAAPGDNTSGEKIGETIGEVAVNSPYASLVNTTTAITFNDMQWYLIGYDDSTVTLLSKECVAGEINYSSEGSSAYSGSDVERYLSDPDNGYYRNHFTEETRTAVYNDKMYLLSLDDAENLSSEVLKCPQVGCWWLSTSSGGDNDARGVNGENGAIIPVESYQYYGVRPVLQLDLSKVTFNATTQTFALPTPDPVPYMAWDETEKKLVEKTGDDACQDYTVVTESTTEWTSGWYVVNGDVTISSEIFASGDMHLILCDGAKLTVENGVNAAGDHSLTIYGQSSGTGELIASAENAIMVTAGSLTINGGTVKASGAGGGMVPGAGINVDGGTITINGGNVTATATGGYGMVGQNIKINGGSVTLIGDTRAIDFGWYEYTLSIADGLSVMAGADEATAEDVTATFATNHEQKWVRTEKLVAHTHDDITFQPWTSADSLPSESGSYYLTRDVVISDSWKIEGTDDENFKTINLCLNGYGIRFSGDNGPAVYLFAYATLNLYDCNTTRNHYVTLTDGRGTAVSDTPVDGAVAVAGGYITGGFANGGAVDAPYMGGGVCVSIPSYFNMYGGTIIGNKAWQGGGVHVDGMAYFNMYGGVITRNTAFAGTPSKGAGGGVFVEGETHMYGGEITGNTAVTGGGVYSAGDYIFYLHGGQITGNTASSQGGGVYVTGERGLNLSGSPVITGNKKGDDANNLCVAGNVRVKEAMSTGASIGVTLPGGTGEFASGEPVYDNNTYTTYFTSDNPAYSVLVDGAWLKLAAHEHSFTYGAEGAVLTATCTGTVGTCGLTDSKVTLTIAAPTLTTYGGTGSAEATLEGWEAFNAATGQSATAAAIRYQGREETTYGESATAPTAPGKYTAKITVQGVTASVNYEIGKATPTVDDFTFTAPDPIYNGNPKSASVAVKEGVTGMGNVTVKYYSDEARTQSVENPTNVGTYYVGITTIGGSNYTAMESVLHGENWQFTIERAQADAADFDFIPPADLTYDGSTKSATVTPKQGITGMGSVTKVKYYSDADYTQSVENPTNVGTYYVVVTVAEGDNYYPPMLGVSDPSWYFTIGKADPDADDFDYATPTDLTYDGSAKSATVTAKDGVNGMGQVIVKYYSNAARTTEATPTDVGTYYVGITVDGGSNYNAAVLYDAAWQFTIGKTNPAAENFTFTPPTDLTYDGSAKSATVTAKDDVNGMGQATVKYYSDANCTTEANPVNVGTYYVGVTVDDGSNYNAATVISDPNWRFAIAKAAPKAEHFTCSTPTDLVYDGTQKSVTIAVKDGIVGMGEAWVNYYYDANFSGGADPINAGIYFFGIRTLPGANYNAAEIELRNAGWWFSIAKADPNAGHFNYTAPANLIYDGSAKSATATVKDDVNGMGDVTVKYYSDAQRTIPATPTDVGTYYVGVAVSEGDNYKAAVVYDEAWQFTISRIDPETGDFTYTAPNHLTYDGSAKSATVTAKDDVNGMGDVTVKYYSDAACENEAEPTDAGTYYVGITVAQGKNYNATDTDLRDPSWSFTVVRLDPTADDFTFATPTDLTYDGNAKSATVTVKDGVNGMGDVTVNYYSDAQRTTPATPTDAGTYYVGITVAAGKNYNATDTDLHNEGWQFAIAKADIHPTVSMKNWTEGYRASEPVLEGNPGQGDVTFTYAKQGKDDFTDKKPTSAGRYIVKATVAETANYNGGEATAEFTINADDSADLTVTSPLTSVSRVTLNGRVVSPANYIVAGGNVYFTDAFLASLKPGTYTIKVTDGTKTATATYRIAANGVAESTVLSATTGDPGVVLYGLLAVSSTLGLAWMGKKRKED